MTALQLNRIISVFKVLFAARWTGRVSDYCENNIVFKEPKLSGPFSFAGREYFREPLDSWGDPMITDTVLCFGTRTGKTRIIFGGLAWRIEHDATRALYVMPNTQGTGGARNVSTTRFIPMCKASAISRHIPIGTDRHKFKALQQVINGSIIDWTGSNSPANLAGNPCDVVIQDETDKYKRLGDREADPSKLADERCREFSNPKRFKVSTPTLDSGIIWQELLKSDFRRRFMPCPHCSKLIIFAWSKDMTILKHTGNEAFVKWDKEAKRKDGLWDYDRVAISARYECPRCGGHIRDNHKTKMDRDGKWIATQQGSPGFRGYHLPSMYAASRQTNVGVLAVKFLEAKNSLLGLQSFINSTLAEPYQSQDRQRERIELVSKTQIEIGDEWHKQLTADCQYKSPHFWYVVRAFKDKQSEGIEAGSCDTVEALRLIQLKYNVADMAVMLDSGYGAISDAELYKNCARFGEAVPRNDGLPIHLGWVPSKGFPAYKRWTNKEGLIVPYHSTFHDPYQGTTAAGQIRMELFEFSSDFIKDILEDLRKGKAGHKWTVSQQMDNDEYWRHMDAKIKVPHFDKSTGRTFMKWKKRSERWPDHLDDCEIMQIAFAAYFEKINVSSSS